MIQASCKPPLPSPKVKIIPSIETPCSSQVKRKHIQRTTQSKQKTKKSAKDFSQNKVERELRYSKSGLLEIDKSFLKTHKNFQQKQPPKFHLEESIDTIKPRVNSKDSKKSYEKFEAATKILDGLSLANKSGFIDRSKQEYYGYWKGKAHQYLEANMKLMEDNRRFSKENQNLKTQISRLTSIVNQKKDLTPEKFNGKQHINKFHNMTKLYMKKIQTLEQQLNRKQTQIQFLEKKQIELNKKISGENERGFLLQRLRKQVDEMSQERMNSQRENWLRESYNTPQKSKQSSFNRHNHLQKPNLVEKSSRWKSGTNRSHKSTHHLLIE